ncbi:MAG: S8 family serine peptidase [Actinomycetota bacterium]
MFRRPVLALSLVLLFLFSIAPLAGAEEDKKSYIVVLKESVDDPRAVAREHASEHAAELSHVYEFALKGYAARIPEGRLNALRADERVAYVEEDLPVAKVATQTSATWGLDRIDQRDLPLNSSYTYNATGSGVTAYIIDTGIRFSHSEFGGRAVSGVDKIDGGTADDCDGHGTHVAGTVGGSTYGVAKQVRLVAVRVLDCNGSGSTSGVIAGVDWVTSDHAAGAPAAANMSLGGGASSSLDTAVKNSITDGISYSVSAGNGDFLGRPQNACNYSPARVAEALTISATDKTDTKASWANYGSCVDLFAPGVSITSAWSTSDTATDTISGTSMASPHVAGVAALYLEANPSAGPAAVAQAITSNATPNKVSSPGSGTPNRLLYSGFISAEPDTTPPAITSGPNANNVTDVSADIVWTTDEASDSRVDYGTSSGSYTESGTNTSMVTSHSLAVAGLTASTTYYYRVTSTDGAGNSVASAEASFTTAAAPPPPPPASNLGVEVAKTSSTKQGNRYVIGFQVTVTDSSTGAAVSGASVSLKIGSGGCPVVTAIATGSGTTDSSGRVTFTFKTRNTGTHCASATATKSGYNEGSGSTAFAVP